MTWRLLAMGLAAAMAAHAYTWDFTGTAPWYYSPYGNTAWTANGDVQAANGWGMAFPAGGSLIWNSAVSGANPNDCDVSSVLNISGSSSTF